MIFTSKRSRPPPHSISQAPLFSFVFVYLRHLEAWFLYSTLLLFLFPTYGIIDKAFIFVKMFYSSKNLQFEKANRTFFLVTSAFHDLQLILCIFVVTHFDIWRNTSQGSQHSLKNQVSHIGRAKFWGTQLIAVYKNSWPTILSSFSSSPPHQQNKQHPSTHCSTQFNNPNQVWHTAQNWAQEEANNLGLQRFPLHWFLPSIPPHPVQVYGS